MLNIIRHLFHSRQAETTSVSSDKGSDKSCVHDNLNPPLRFSLEFNGQSFLYRNGTAALGVTFRSDKPAKVDSLFIAADNNRFQALDWQPFSFSNSHNRLFKFDLAAIISILGEKRLNEIKLNATVGRENYQSPPFDITSLIK